MADSKTTYTKVSNISLLALYASACKMVSFLQGELQSDTSVGADSLHHRIRMEKALTYEKQREKDTRDELLRRLGVDHV